jgi:hypothetical protein
MTEPGGRCGTTTVTPEAVGVTSSRGIVPVKWGSSKE